MVETLSGVLTGAAVANQIGLWAVGDPSVPTDHGAAFIAIRIGAMMPIDEFKQRIDALARQIREAPRAEGADRVYLPGDREWERRRRALIEGVALPDDVKSAIAELARELGIGLKIM